VKIEPEGLQALRESREAMEQMWRGADAKLKAAR
jgi:hypothetical protein